jgi:hypothetical protein
MIVTVGWRRESLPAPDSNLEGGNARVRRGAGEQESDDDWAEGDGFVGWIDGEVERRR